MTNTNFTVTSEGNASSGATSLNGAIASIDIGGANAAINTHYTITFGNTINLTDGNLLAVNLSSGSSLTIQGGNFLLNGEGNQRGFFVYSGAVDIHNLTIENTQAVGGLGSYYSGGGGGGAGLGGGLFVASAGSVVLDNVSFSGSKATGGNGGYGQQAFINGVGGGGGMGGCGGSGQSSFTGSGVTAGGGGGGLGLSPYNQFGGDAFGGSGRSGIVPGAVGGGSGQNGGSGGAWGGGGGAGGGMNFYTTGGGFNPTNGTYSPGNMHTAAIPGIGGGGGIGGVSGATGQRPNGGFGGGGGGGTAAAPGGGNGGFGGGGGAGINGGGHGGFGGGGGGNANGQGGSGGFGGGHAGSGGGGSFGAGGGGLGAGGDIFVQCGGSLTLEGGTLSGGSVAAGQGGHGGQGNGGVGADYGSGIFIQGNQTITFSPTSGQTTTVSDVIADMTGSQDPSGQTGQGNIVINGGGTVVLDAINTYTGTTTLSAGSTLELANASGAGTSEIEFQSGSTAILRIDGATMPTNTIDDFASGDIIDLRGLAFTAGAVINYWSNTDTLTVTSNGVTENLSMTNVQGGVVAVSDGASGTPGTDIETGAAGTPTVTMGATATFNGGGSAVVLDAGATVSDSSGVGITGATVTIESGYATGDTLNFTNQNGITGSYSEGVLTLTGDATAAQYQTALEAITYGVSPSNGDPTNGGGDTSRTIDWVVINATGNSNTGTSTLDTDHVAPTVTAAGSVSYAVGGSAVTLDPTLTASAPDSGGDLHSATISVAGGTFSADGDTLSATTAGTNISASYDSADETLTLTGTDTLAHYQTVLESVSLSSTGATTGSRTIDWIVNDGVDSSTTGTSTVTVDTPPTVTAGGTVPFEGGGSAVALDPGLALSNTSGELSSATVTVVGAIAGDTLNFTNSHPSTEGNISVAGDSDGVLVLTSAGDTATVLQWETALESVTYSFSPSDGDPTNGGSDTSRTIHWVVTSAAGVSSGTGSSTLDVVHVAPTVTSSGTVSYTAGGPAAVLDSGLTLADPDSGGNLTGATISLSSGNIAGDSLNFTNQNGITSSYSDGTLTLSGTATVAEYRTALESITYTFTPTSGDPTNGGSDPSRTVTWQVTDGVDTSSSGTTTLNVAADVAPTLSSLSGSAISGADFASGYTATFTIDTSKDVTVANGTTLTLSDGGTATYVSGSGTETLTFTYDATDAPQSLAVTGLTAGSVEDIAGKSLSVPDTTVTGYSDAVTDSAANVATNFANLNSAAAYISSITLNNGGMPALDLTASEVVNDRTLIGKIVGPYDLVVDDSAANFVSNFASLVPYTSEISSVQFTDSGRPIVALSATEILDDQTLIGKIAGPHYLAVYDSASDIQASFDSLETYASSLAAVAFTDTGTPTLNLTATQVTNDATLLSKMYDAYDLMVTGVTGQAYTSYESVYGAYDALKETTDFNTNGSETITAYVSGLTLTGTAYNDTFYLECARSVTASGGAGNDLFFFGSGFSNSDQIDGGGGSNTLDLDGTYTGSNALTISTSMMSNIQTLGLVTGHSYDITPDAGVVTTGQTLTVSAATLGAGNSLTFDGSALTGGTLTIDAGAGVDELTGGAGTNKFDMAGYFTAADEINGGTGTTTVTLDGDYSGGVTFAATTMVNVDTLDLTTGYSYDLVLNDATVGSGQTMTIQGGSLGAGNGMTIDASAVAAGTLTIDAGAGVDVLTGGAGTNNFSMAGHLTASDEINGGTGTTTVTLDGDYSGGVTFTATTMVNVDTLDLTAGHSYDLVLNDATIGSGQTMTIQGSSLGAGNGMTIDASAVTAGNLTIDAGAGVDDLTGGGATNTFNMGAYLTASDEINGGTGTSTVHLDGDYSGGLTFNATTMVNVDTLDLTAGYSYNLTLNSATVASGDTLTIQATGLSASNSLTLDGSAVDGNLVVHAGSGSSFIEGGLGADQLYAGSGADTFAYAAAADSTGTTFDTISAFNTGSDMIDLAGSLSAVTAIDTAVTTGTLGPTNFTSVLEHDVGAAQLSAYGAVLFTPSSGGYAGNTFLIIDENGVAGYQAGSDLVIELLHGVNLASLSLSNFETAA